MKTGSENIEVIVCSRRILFEGFMAHMEDTRLPKWVMFGELMGGAGCGGAGNTRQDDTRRRNKGRDI